MVMHLVTAAEGSEEAYEDIEYTIEQAIKIDHAISECWNGHSKFVMAKNIKGKNFRDKIQYCITSVNSFIGLPTKNKYYQKYLLDCEDPRNILFPADVKVEHHLLTEIFLKSSREEVQIRISKRVSRTNCRAKTESTDSSTVCEGLRRPMASGWR